MKQNKTYLPPFKDYETCITSEFEKQVIKIFYINIAKHCPYYISQNSIPVVFWLWNQMNLESQTWHVFPSLSIVIYQVQVLLMKSCKHTRYFHKTLPNLIYIVHFSIDISIQETLCILFVKFKALFLIVDMTFLTGGKRCHILGISIRLSMSFLSENTASCMAL